MDRTIQNERQSVVKISRRTFFLENIGDDTDDDVFRKIFNRIISSSERAAVRATPTSVYVIFSICRCENFIILERNILERIKLICPSCSHRATKYWEIINVTRWRPFHVLRLYLKIDPYHRDQKFTCTVDCSNDTELLFITQRSRDTFS